MPSEITPELIFHFMLVFARVAAACAQLPGFGSHYVPIRIKSTIAIAISIILLPLVAEFLPPYSQNMWQNYTTIFCEIIVGLIISIAAHIYYNALHFVGQIVSMQSGLGAAAFFDPKQKNQVAIFSNFLLLATIVVIFATYTHHLFIQAAYDSYFKFPVGQLIDSGDASKFVVSTFSNSFLIAFKLVSPFLVVGLAVMTGSGMLARLMPNFQVFFVITPGQILIIFTTMYIVINKLIYKIVHQISQSLNLM